MAIRRLSYRLDEEPLTGAVRLIPAPAGPQEQESEPSPDFPETAEYVAEHVLAVGHRRGLSRSRLPGGGALLCASTVGTGDRDDGVPMDAVRVDAVCVDAVGELPYSIAELTPDQLAAFARENASRVAPFLADVHRLFDERAGRQIVVAEHDPRTVAHWVALACASLPDAYAASLTFSTWTADPRRAPQQILGIGPDADFDLSDGPTLDHLYRVHDGIGGQSSTPMPDTWAEVTARQWIEGTPPEPPPDGGDPFGVTRPPLGMGRLMAMSEGARRDVVRAHGKSVEGEPAGSPLVDELYRLCVELGGADRAAAEPLALALAQHYATIAEAQGTMPDLAVCERLPLNAEAWQRLRGEFGGRADEALWRTVRRHPVGAWAEPLRHALDLGAYEGRGIKEAMDRLARALLRPGRPGCGEAVDVLEAVGHSGLNRRLLRRLGTNLTDHKLDQLRDLANAPQGQWLLRNIGDAPDAVRLAEAAARWGKGPGGSRGAELFGALTELLPGRRVDDADALRLLWRLVWGGRSPDRADLMWLVRACSARLIIEAGFGVQLVGLLKEPERVDAELVELARGLLTIRLGPRERATAELLVLAKDFAGRRIPVPRAVGDFGAWFQKASPVNVVLREGIGELMAYGLARVDPVDLCRSPGLGFLMAADNDVLRPYRAYLFDGGARERMDDALPQQPAHIAALYHAWRPRQGRKISVEWQHLAGELLAHILAPVVPRLDDWTLGQVANEIFLLVDGRGHGQAQQRVEEWTAWRHSLGPRHGPTSGPGPGPGPGHQQY